MNTQAANPGKTKSRLPLIMLLLLILLAALAAGWYFFLHDKGPEQKAGGVRVQRGDLAEVVTATGTLQPREYVDVGAQVSGQLHKIHVEVGSEVKEGELLAEIDPTLFSARVDASRAQLRYQLAQLDDREAQLALAEIQHKRQQNLLAEDAGTVESAQKAEAELKKARAQIAMLRAQIEQTESSLRADEANLNYARIYAPMSGTVVSINARQGQTLNANQQAPVILRIADLSTMTVQTQVSEADIARLKLDMEAYFTTLGSQQRRWYGKLHRIEPTPEVQNNVVLYNALFDVRNNSRELMPQMTAQVFFVIAETRDALLVPMSALTMQSTRSGPRGDKAKEAAGPGSRRASVQVIGKDGQTTAREVEVGVSDRIQAEITSGLEEGETILLQAAGGGSRSAAPGGMNRPARLR